MMKQLFAATALVALAASPAMAISSMSNKPQTGTPSSHVRAADASGGYMSNGHYVRPHDRIGWTHDRRASWNPVTGVAALAFAPVYGVFGGYGYGNDAYAQAPGYAVGAPTAVSNGEAVGWDPDPNVQLELLRGSVRYE